MSGRRGWPASLASSFLLWSCGTASESLTSSLQADRFAAAEWSEPVNLGPVVVNGLYEDVPGLDADPATAAAIADTSLRAGEAESLAEAASFRRHRMELQREQVARLATGLPLSQLHLPYLFNADIGAADVDDLARALLGGISSLEAARR